jgi:uncharacterized membrane protein (GlpM family)
MNFAARLAISVAIIAAAALMGRRFPTLAGLIATMPLAGLVVLLWLYSENRGDGDLMVRYTRGALWGILPCIGFYLVALLGFEKRLPLAAVLGLSFGAWLLGAAIHQWLLR